MSQKSSSSTSERDIYRVAHERRWTVHIKRNGRVWCKSFQDEQEGGESAALQAAKAGRDATCAEHPLMGQRARMQALTVKNTTGVPDVYHWNDGNGNPYWKAQTSLGSKTLARVFSVARYGDAGAFGLAVKERHLHLDRLTTS